MRVSEPEKFFSPILIQASYVMNWLVRSFRTKHQE